MKRNIINGIVFFLFLSYGLFFAVKYGRALDLEYLRSGVEAFWLYKKPWIMLSYAAAILYILWIFINYLLSPAGERKNPGKKDMLAIFAAAFLLRLVPALFIFGPDTDVGAFQRSVYLTHGMNDWRILYEYMPYFYSQVYIFDFFARLLGPLNFPGYLVVKMPVIIFDALNAVIIAKISSDRGNGLRYAFNPVSVFVSAYHGMFDAVTVFFVLLLLFSQAKKFSGWIKGLFFGMAFQNKIWPVILLPHVLIRSKLRDLPKFILSWLAVFAALSIPALFNPDYYLKVLRNSSIEGCWGLGAVFLILNRLFLPDSAYNFMYLCLKVIFWLVLIISVYRFRKDDLNTAAYKTILLFYVFTPGWGIQYMIWLVPFVLILGRENFWRTLFTFVYMFAAYFALILYHAYKITAVGADAVWLFLIILSLPAWWLYARELFIMDNLSETKLIINN